ncbi:MAG TPA: molybdopterin-dependent oxidoreductase [Myxococcaceae bacterium]|nr:molybdopterin-dependent oxidoreductase [Myxococcaceae bacterium]
MPLHHRTCTLCEAMCGLTLEVEGETVTSLRGDREDPFSRGFLCPKATALPDVHADPDRLRHPVRRTSSGWARVSWREALDETAERLAGIQESAGRDAAAVYLGNPSVHNWGTVLAGVPLVKALGTKNRYSRPASTSSRITWRRCSCSATSFCFPSRTWTAPTSCSCSGRTRWCPTGA